MTRASRTFRLTLSPEGMNLLIESHCRLIRTTRSLLAWGTTLHVALHHLATLPTDTLIDDWGRFPNSGLHGDLIHHLGAPIALQDIATNIVTRIREAAPGAPYPRRGAIYIIALQHLASAKDEPMRSAYHVVLG